MSGPTESTNYALLSAAQVEEGPRLLSPHFGFFYKAKNTKIKVILVEKPSTQHVILNILENELNNEIERKPEWKYYGKNLSDVTFLSTAWSGNTRVEWQVCFIFFSAAHIRPSYICKKR